MPSGMPFIFFDPQLNFPTNNGEMSTGWYFSNSNDFKIRQIYQNIASAEKAVTFNKKVCMSALKHNYEYPSAA